MKKLFSVILVALLLCGAALAEYEPGTTMVVDYCNEYITLREEPDTRAAALDRVPLGSEVIWVEQETDDFVKVFYKGQIGYVLLRYLSAQPLYVDVMPLTLEERYNINLFLSNFSESGFALYDGGHFDIHYAADAQLIDFGINHVWFNQKDHLEWGEWGYDNVRLAEKYVARSAEKYFGIEPVYMWDVEYMTYKDGYYYWCETGGHINDGFVSLDYAQDLGEGLIGVRFKIYACGEEWDNDVCYFTAYEAQKAYPNLYNEPGGFAVIDIGEKAKLSDRSTWTLNRYTVQRGWYDYEALSANG